MTATPLRFFTALAVSGLLVSSCAPRTIDDSSRLGPFADDMKRLLLSNGVTVYETGHEVKKDSDMVLILAVAGGSSAENPGEEGYAHFVEHLAFCGTKNFPGDSANDFFKGLGFELGGNWTGYTNKEKTWFTIFLPAEKREYYVTASRILADFARNIRFDESAVEKERSIILEEMRFWNDDNAAFAKNYDRLLYAGSPLDNPVLGTVESIRGATPQKLRSFFERTYRPANIFAILIGATPSELEKIGAILDFRPLRGQSGDRAAILPGRIADNGFLSYDSQVPGGGQSAMLIRRKANYASRVNASYPDVLLEKFALDAADARLKELTETGKGNWLRAAISGYVGGGDCDVSQIVLDSPRGKGAESLKALLAEIRRLRDFGITEREFAELKKRWDYFQTDGLVKFDDGTRSTLESCFQNFMFDSPVRVSNLHRDYVQKYLGTVSLAMVNESLRQTLDLAGCTILLQSEAGPGGSALTEPDVRALMADGSREASQAYDYTLKPVQFAEAAHKPGTVEYERDRGNGVTELILGNGARVLLLATGNLTQDKLYFTAIAPGGYESAESGDKRLYEALPELVGALDAGGYDAASVSRYRSDNTVTLEADVRADSLRLDGNCSLNSLDEFFSLLGATLTSTQANPNAFRGAKNRLWASWQKEENNPDARFDKLCSGMPYNGYSAEKVPSREYLDGITSAAAIERFEELFLNPSRFTYVFSFHTFSEYAKKLVVDAIGNIPNRAKSKTLPAPRTTRTDGPATHRFSFTREDKASVKIVWAQTAPMKIMEADSLTLLARLLENRLFDLIREENGKTYELSVELKLSRSPPLGYALEVSFYTDPAFADRAVEIINQEVNRIKEGELPDSCYQDIRNQDSIVVDNAEEYYEYLREEQLEDVLISDFLKAGFDLTTRFEQRSMLFYPDNISDIAKARLPDSGKFVFILEPPR